MSDVDPVRLVEKLSAGERLVTPAVRPIDPEVRSGGLVPFCDLLKHDANQAEVQQLLDNSVLLGSLVIEWGYDVLFERHDEFKAWLIDNEAALAAAVPPGVTYRGTYIVTVSTDKHGGFYRTIWGFRTLSALDSFADSIHSGSPFAELVSKLNSFRDRVRSRDYSQQYYQPVRCADLRGS